MTDQSQVLSEDAKALLSVLRNSSRFDFSIAIYPEANDERYRWMVRGARELEKLGMVEIRALQLTVILKSSEWPKKPAEKPEI